MRCVVSLNPPDNSKNHLKLVNQLDVAEDDFLPRNPVARMAVLKSREIVKRNNEFIATIKKQSRIDDQNSDELQDSEFFSQEDSYPFDLYKIKSKSSIKEIIKDIFSL